MLLGILAILCAGASALICVSAGAFESLCWLWALPVGFVGCFAAALGLLFLFIWQAGALEFFRLSRR